MKAWKWIVAIVVVCVIVLVITLPLVLIDRDTDADADADADEDHEGPLVNTNVGPIRGLLASRGDYSMFLGIPYAIVNSSNPFGPSIPHEGFEDTFNAFNDSAVCPQGSLYPGGMSMGTLDCLHLNIHVPKTASPDNRLPVMLWIHGGAFVTGFSDRTIYDPVFLVEHDVIVVTINYRVGAYGFLCLDIPEVPGNQGLKDQLTAMRWVKNNIEAFGGDTNKITVFGESAGAMSVDLHFIYAQEDLFNNVILQSGTALSFYSYNSSNPAAALELAAYLGHATDDLYDALDFLKTQHTDQVVQATTTLGLTIRPCVEQEFENVERYITTRPALADVPNAKTKPVLIGFNDNEFGINFLDPWSGRDPMEDIEDFYYFFNREYLAEAVGAVRNFYLGDDDYDGDEKERQIGNFRSDFGFLHPSYRTIEKYMESGATSIHHYMFTYVGDRNFLRTMWNATVDGALHADELSYLFDMEIFPETPTPRDQLMIDRITTLWTNFAKYSNPVPETSDLLPIQWPIVTNESMHCMILDSVLRLQRRAFHDRMAFWDLFYTMFEAMS